MLFRRSCLNILAATALLLVLLPHDSRADAAIYKLKAVYLFNFTNYVTWPGADDVISVCIYKDDDVESALKYIAQKQPKLSVRSVGSPEEVSNCAMVYIGSSAGDEDTGEVLKKLSGHSILSVGENASFIRGGGMVQLFVKDDKLKIKIRRSTLENAGLKASSKLLEMALLVD